MLLTRITNTKLPKGITRYINRYMSIRFIPPIMVMTDIITIRNKGPATNAVT